MKKNILAALGTSLFLLLASSALASSITLDIGWSNSNFTQYTVYVDNGDAASTYAGSFWGEDVNSTFKTDVYCVEITQSIDGKIYTFDVNNLFDVDERYQKAGWLMDTFAYLTGTSGSAALQVAIWEVIHEQGTDFDLFSGSFGIDTSTSVPYLDLLNTISDTFLAANGAYTAFDMTSFATFTSATKQDLIGINPNPVPEPSTMLLFGAGCAAITGVRRKK